MPTPPDDVHRFLALRRRAHGHGRAVRLGLALLVCTALVACGAPPTLPPDNGGPEAEELALDALSATTGTRGDTVSVQGENIAGTATVTFGGQAVAATVYDAQNAVVAGQAKTGVRAEFVVPVVASAQNTTVSVTVSQTTTADGAETETLTDAFTYLVDGRLEELGDFVYSFSDDTVGGTPSYVEQPWIVTDVTVESSTWARDGRVLRIAPYEGDFGGLGYQATVFTEVGAIVEVEVLMRVRDLEPTSDLHWMTGAGARIGGTEHSEQGLLSQMVGDDTDSELIAANLNRFEATDDVLTGVTFTRFEDEPRGTYLRSRWTLDGVTRLVSIKTWEGTVFDEPEAWNVLDHDLVSTIPAGGVGITRFFNEHVTEVDWIAITVLD